MQITLRNKQTIHDTLSLGKIIILATDEQTSGMASIAALNP